MRAALLFACVLGAAAQPGKTRNNDADSNCAQASCCSEDGSDPSLCILAVSGTTRNIVTSHCPNHAFIGLTPNYPYKASTKYTIPRNPEYVAMYTVSLEQNGGAVGVLLDGAMYYSAYGGPDYDALDMSEGVNDYANSAPFAEGYSFDMCNELSSSSNSASYHAHSAPGCLLRQLGDTAGTKRAVGARDREIRTATFSALVSPQIGWSVDGLPVYGPRIVYRYFLQGYYQEEEEAGACGADVWNDLGTGETEGYSYGMAESFYPFSPLCIHGCCPTGTDCSWDALPDCGGYYTVAGTTSEYDDSLVAYPNGLDYYDDVDACDCDDVLPSDCSNYDVGEACDETADCHHFNGLETQLSCVCAYARAYALTTPAPTHAPTAAPTAALTAAPTACDDSTSWLKGGQPKKDCAWVSKKTSSRCSKTDADGATAAAECAKACVSCTAACTDVWAKKNQPSKDCAWVSKKPSEALQQEI
ncbi:hypothetical protein M885DRAFT_497750 [Pelagophyceae sp. CCMP2097]|nr:hypothetical protein M885DRAFT_497750 [Pelagophyceae sp. CCMP2097]